MTDIDKLGESLKKRIGAFQSRQQRAETERQSIGADLRQICEAFEGAKKNKVEIEINGCSSKTQYYTEFLKITPRYAQYLKKDGSRKGQKPTRTTVRGD